MLPQQLRRIAVRSTARTILVRRSAVANGAAQRSFATSPVANEVKKDDGDKLVSSQENIDKTKLERLAKDVMSLNLSETIAFIELMQKALGLGDVRSMMKTMSSAAPAAAGGAPSASAKADAPKKEAPAAPAKTIFELKLESFEAGDKIKVIKVVREITGLGLKEAKDLVEGVPKVLMKEVAKDQGAQLVDKLKAAGAKATLA